MLDLGYRLTKPLLFSWDPETAHERVLHSVGRMPRLIRALAGSPGLRPELARTVAGLHFPSPVGLAAGLDKEALALPVWERFGFGFVELGTVTPRAQAGNPRPRVHRLREHGAIVNAMGFPSSGMAVVAERLERWRERDLWPTVPVGANIGKNKDTPAESAHQDYGTLAETLAPLVDYLAVNVSSPNTPGLRALQSREPLLRILGRTLESAHGKPVFVKFAPDMDDAELQEAVDAALEAGVSGIIATNTTRSRCGIAEAEALTGGLSGEPLFPIARERIQAVLRIVSGRVPVIGVGGVHDAQTAKALLDDGCAAVQLYTGLIYGGPRVVRRINAGL